MNDGILSEMLLTIPYVSQVIFPSVPSSNALNDATARLNLIVTIRNNVIIPITVLYQDSVATLYSDNVSLSNTDKVVVNSLISRMLEHIIDGDVIIL